MLPTRSDVREPSPEVRLLATECEDVAWAVDADSVERIVRRSEWLEAPPLDVAHTLALRPFAEALERVLMVQGVSGAKALLSQGRLRLIELLASDVQTVPNIVYGSCFGPVRSVVLEATDFPVLICDPESLEAALGRRQLREVR